MVTEIKTSAEFKTDIEQHKIVFIEFFAQWCGACKLFKSQLDEVANFFNDHDGVGFYQLDVDNLPEIAKEQDVEATPTLVFYFEGKELWRFVGYLDSDSLKEKVRRLTQEHLQASH